MLIRIDPIDCGCTDCMTGDSRPVNQCTDYHKMRCALGEIENASGGKFIICVDWVEQ
jgi:hypothetical protein